MPNTEIENTIELIELLSPFYRFDNSITGIDYYENKQKFEKLTEFMNIPSNINIMEQIDKIQERLLRKINISFNPLTIINIKNNNRIVLYQNNISTYDILQHIKNISNHSNGYITSISLTNFNTIKFS